MTRFAVLGVWFFMLSLSAIADDKKEVLKELEPFQGTWKLTRAELNGKVVDDAKLQFTFKGDKVEYEAEQKGTGSIAVDAKKSPTEIDLLTDKGDKSPGIYKFEEKGEKLVICFVEGGDKRPTKFDSTELPDAVLLTFEKAKK